MCFLEIACLVISTFSLFKWAVIFWSCVGTAYLAPSPHSTPSPLSKEAGKKENWVKLWLPTKEWESFPWEVDTSRKWGNSLFLSCFCGQCAFGSAEPLTLCSEVDALGLRGWPYSRWAESLGLIKITWRRCCLVFGSFWRLNCFVNSMQFGKEMWSRTFSFPAGFTGGKCSCHKELWAPNGCMTLTSTLAVS